MAASATFALKAGVWFRRGRLLMVSPDSAGTACPLSGRNSTYRPVQISRTSSHATFQLELTKILLPILQYKMDVDMFLYDTTSRRFENLFGIPAMIVAVVGTLLLIISTVKFDDPLSLWAFYLIVLIGFAPIVVMLILNYGLLWHMKTKFGPDYDRYWKFVHLDMGGKLRPYAEIISRARHNRDHPDRRIPIT